MNMDKHSEHDEKAKVRIAQDVKKYGFHIAYFERTDYLPGFAYTIGLHEKNHPELIVFGLSQELMGFILNEMGAKILNGEVFEIGRNYDDFIEGYPIQLVKVDKDYYPNYLGYCSWYNGFSEEYSTYQVIWPDKEGKFPWEDEFNKEWIFMQPLLDRNIDYKFYEPKNRCVFTTKSVLEGKPILRAYHNQDGDWQFHHENDPDIEDAKAVALSEIVKIDPSLNEIYYLNYGQYAERLSQKDKWEIFEEE